MRLSRRAPFYNAFLRLGRFCNILCPPLDIEEEFLEVYDRCQNHTMTSLERLYAMYKVTEYIVANRIPGDIVECGVWQGGSVMASALCLKKMGDLSRKLYLYDTFEGMTPPSARDTYAATGKAAQDDWEQHQRSGSGGWQACPEDVTRENLLSTGYPAGNLVFVRGKVEDTIPATLPAAIALLRLDTNWYESTRHELRHLFPRLSPGGALIVDDYGYWAGCREAVDEYIREQGVPLLLSRIDHTGRLAIKPGPPCPS